MKAIALALALVASPALAQAPPDDFFTRQVPIGLHCTKGGMERMAQLLRDDWQEVPVVMSVLSRNTTFYFFVGPPPHNTSSLVILKTGKDVNEACLLWSGASNGLSYMTNPAPDYPEPKTGTDT